MVPDSGPAALGTETSANRRLRYDLQLIADMIEPGSRVLDIGCGDGGLLDYLEREKQVDGRGIEISQDGVNACVTRGLSVIQGNADTDLGNYPEGAFDYVVLSQTLQATHNPRAVIESLVRIGRFAVVSFVNFGHWRTRLSLLLHGKIPVPGGAAHNWYDSPDIHLCTLFDFVDLCDALGLQIESAVSLDRQNRTRVIRNTNHFANLYGEQAVFLLSRTR
jgi:methionine biosynthesis protein MetW